MSSTKENSDLLILGPYLSPAQLQTLHFNLHGQEGVFFAGKIAEYAKRITEMPGPYGQENKGENAICYLHYFRGGCDWFITEKDESPQGQQAFGLAHITETEMGYISIPELVRNGVELDLYFTPCSLAEARRRISRGH